MQAPVKRFRRRCNIDDSPVRADIEFLYKKNVPLSEIAGKYHEAFGVKVTTMAEKIQNHINRNHPPAIDPTPVTKQEIEERKANGNFIDYSQELLKVGMQPDMLNSKKVSHSHVIAAQRTLLEERKIKGAENAQKLMMMKFFRGAEVIPGEVVEDGNESTGGTALPANTD